MAKKMKLSDITNMFAGMDVEALEGVTIERDIEIDLGGLGGGFDPMLAAALGQESAVLAQHFARIAGMFGYSVGIVHQQLRQFHLLWQHQLRISYCKV
ncbi:CO dehydrogenase/acetyl-CoA synthase subunit delta, corrinoid iron-sulfur subcomplex small subunit [Methanosarcina mazei LYC]|uniref:CO dehydrogenase/acetyl-CoA synthase subunit delta, corrinoid iron-sulfur subcomplex small subunit n=1 Tax=Methanosarcina mazei LYC TaxID=1434114 RepID=A0A0E3RQI7_METMZ|nr:CO dehydrogenase/acetyl-CoA synthase subunit delta, corrinoid iron-sulfur subcomplex small subunit [Methanosarcina mazei LYC]